MWMVILILSLNASGPALEWPSQMVPRMSSSRPWVFPHGSTILGMRLWEARKIHRSSPAPAWSMGRRRSPPPSSYSGHLRPQREHRGAAFGHRTRTTGAGAGHNGESSAGTSSTTIWDSTAHRRTTTHENNTRA